MNKHEVRGGARYLGGKVEKAVGDAVDSRDWQIAGVTDQVAGGAEHLYGRTQSIAGEVADAAPGILEKTREQLSDTAGEIADAAKRGARRAADAARTDERMLWAGAALAGGYALGWLVHGRRG